MSSSRYVDTVPAPASEVVKEKKVILLGNSRTGTMGLCKALEIIGHKSYSMPQATRNGYSHLAMFNEAMRIKRTGKGLPYSRTDFDKWIWNYDVISTVPYHLTEEIIEAYPDAKFILTVRDPEAWANSVWDTVGLLDARMQSFPTSFSKYFDRTELQFSILIRSIFDDASRGHGRTVAGFRAAMKGFEEYNARVRTLVPADRLLVIRLEDGLGWEQICPFLGVDTPAVPYPRMNDTKHFQGNTKRLMRSGQRRASWLTGAVAAIAVGFWYLRLC